MSSPETTPHIMGSRLSAKGYLNDSMGLLIDPRAFYDVDHKGSQVLAIYRTGLPRPRRSQELKKR